MKTKDLNDIISPVLGKGSDLYKNIMISNITYDSRKVKSGSLFIAIKGYQVDGHSFLPKVEKLGALAAIVEDENLTIQIPQIKVQNSRVAMAKIAKEFYAPELSKLRTVGVTGTNGKTTTTYLIKGVLESAGFSCGLIGTIEYDIANKKTTSWNTTPESTDLLDMMYSMYSQGQKACVMEVSSHGLALKRADSVDFDVAVFTNLSQDHLDFHKDFEDYYRAKRRLFELLKPNGLAVINNDDPYGERLLKEIPCESITFGIESESKVKVKNWSSSLSGIEIEIETPLGVIIINSPLIGQFNVENVLATVSAGLAFNFDLKTIKNGIEKVDRIPGRLEPRHLRKGAVAIVDYSHTPDALKKALIELSKINKNNLWVVFGCGGDRDKAKRPIMGKIAKDYATNVVITSDNPRSENPENIIQDILSGIENKQNVVIESDRKNAIQFAIEKSEKNDIILIAGKGHETYQEIKGVKHTFDDRQVIRNLDQ